MILSQRDTFRHSKKIAVPACSEFVSVLSVLLAKTLIEPQRFSLSWFILQGKEDQLAETSAVDAAGKNNLFPRSTLLCPIATEPDPNQARLEKLGCAGLINVCFRRYVRDKKAAWVTRHR